MTTLPVLILAGGLGTRLSTISGSSPKVLIPLLNRPFLAWKLEGLQKQGVTEVILILGKGADQVEEFLKSYPTDLKIKTYRDGNQPLGTAGAIRKHYENLPPLFVLTFGDNLLDFNLGDLENAFFNREIPLMVCTNQIWPNERFNLKFNGDLIVSYDKNGARDFNYADYGYSVFRKSDFGGLETEKFYDLSVVIHSLIRTSSLGGIRTEMKYYEIGTPTALQNTLRWLNLGLKE